MMLRILPLLAIGAALVVMPACGKKESSSGGLKEKVDDALDRRPNEKLKDAAEDVGDAAKDAAKDLKEAVKEEAEKVKEAVEK